MTDQIPALPTLADMTYEERRECRWMQADVIGFRGKYVLVSPSDWDGDAVLLDREGDVYYEDHASVTPRPDLPRMEWPGDKEAEPAPDLPDGWRLADHQKYGRVIVTDTTMISDGRVYFVFPSADRLGYDWLFCDPSELTYIDGPTAKGDGTSTGPDHLTVGTVIESADDPRLAALPDGSILLDRDGETVAKQSGAWRGDGYLPIPSEGDTYGPWTVLHVGQEADQ